MKFIEAYKKLENAVYGIEELEDKTVVGFENAFLKDIHELNMMRYCRYTRNYIQHNRDYESFTAVTPAMMEFLECETKYAYSLQRHVGDVMTSSRALAKDVDIITIAKKLKKAPLAVIAEKGRIIAVYDETALRDAVIAQKTILTIPSRIRFVTKDTLLRDASGPCVVTGTGTRNGKYLGISG